MHVVLQTIHVFLLAENVWETKPMVMDLNLFDSFLLTVFEVNLLNIALLHSSHYKPPPLAPTYPVMYWVV